MALLSTLVAFTLRQVSIESGEQVVTAVRQWLIDPSLDLHKAIKKANEHTWHSLTLALGGDGWLDRIRGLVSGSDVRGMRDQVKVFLRSANVGMEGLDGRFRKNCLEELKRLKGQGRLEFDSLDPSLISQRAKAFRRFDEPSGLAREARRAAQQLAVELVNEAPNLSQLLQLPLAGDERPLMVTAFDFFLRREIVERPQLYGTMMLDATERLYADQASGFETVRTLLGGFGGQMDRIIDVMVVDLDEIREGMGRTVAAAERTDSKIDLLMDLLEEREREIAAQLRRDEAERREMRSLIQLLLEAVNEKRQEATGYLPPSPFVLDAQVVEEDDRAVVEALLDRSPLAPQVRALLGVELDRELKDRIGRAVGRAAGTRLEGPHGMTLVWIPPGSFFMGSPTSEPCRDPDEFPHHVMLTRGFWMGSHLITRKQWWKVMRSMPDDVPANDHPIEGISWEEANEFLDVLVEQMEYEFAFRLPSEAEWEYACRAGTVTPFAYGFRLSSDQANFNAATFDEQLSAPPRERREGTTPVGTFPPNAWGLYDLHGNVMEWCSDWYGPYDVHKVEDPTGPQRGQARVLRGGGWWSPVHACRSARRSSALPDANTLPAGFRVVLVER